MMVLRRLFEAFTFLLILLQVVKSKDVPEVCLYSTAVITCETETDLGFLGWDDGRGNFFAYNSPLDIDQPSRQLGPFNIWVTEISNKGKNFTATATIKNVTLTDMGKFILCSDSVIGNVNITNVSIQINTRNPPAPLNLRCIFSSTNTDVNCAWDPPTSSHCITEYVVMKNGLMINTTQETNIAIPDSQISIHNNFTVFGKNILGHNGPNSGAFVLIKSAPRYNNVSHGFRYNNFIVTLIVYWTFVPNIPLPTSQSISQDGRNRQTISAASRNASLYVTENSVVNITLFAANGIGEVTKTLDPIYVPVNQSPSPVTTEKPSVAYKVLTFIFGVSFLICIVSLMVVCITFYYYSKRNNRNIPNKAVPASSLPVNMAEDLAMTEKSYYI